MPLNTGQLIAALNAFPPDRPVVIEIIGEVGEATEPFNVYLDPDGDIVVIRVENAAPYPPPPGRPTFSGG